MIGSDSCPGRVDRDGRDGRDERDDEARLGCPRCGHDLRGLPATWSETCPLQGRCPECGLDVAWGEIFGRRLDHPAWCLEGARGPISWAARLLPHLFMVTIRPRAALRRLRMEHHIRFGRLASGIVALLALVVVVAWGAVLGSYLRDDVPFGPAVRESLRAWDADPRVLSLPLPRAGSGRAVFRAGRRSWVGPYREGSAALVLHPADPIPRVGLDVDGPAAPGAPQQMFVEVRTTGGDRVIVPAATGGPIGSPVGGWVWSTHLHAARAMGSWSVVVPPPQDALAPMVGDAFGLVFLAGVPLIVTAVASSLAFAALPIARRRARVRAVHLLRLSGYAALGMAGLGILAVGLAGATGRLAPFRELEHRLGFDALAGWLGMPTEADLLLGLFFACVLPMLLAATWWSMAARHYLRMMRPVAVGVSVAMVSNLAIITTVVLLGRDLS